MKKILLFVAGLMLAMSASAEITLYYVNSGNWASVNAYVWPTGGDGIVGWPGAEATATGEKAKGFDVYSYTFDETLADNVIFNDGSAQTGDMQFDASKPYCYGGEWYASIAEIEGAGELPTYSYYIAGTGVAGSGWCCDKTWNPAGCGLVDNTVTYTALPAGEYKFKITDGSWATTWGFTELSNQAGFEGDADNNVVVTLASASDVTISFDGSSITVTIAGGSSEEGGGEGEGEGGDDIVPTSEYYMAGAPVEGTDWVCGENWNPAGCPLENGTKEFANLPAGEYKFKITNGAWPNAEGTGGSCWGFADLANAEGLTEDADANVVITLAEPSNVSVSFDGTLITVVITPAQATDLEDVDAEDAVVAAYDITGKPVAADAKGLVILQYASGKAVKIFN